jgi:nitrate/nitrite transporter NarK
MMQSQVNSSLVQSQSEVSRHRRVANLPLRIVAACLVALATAVHYTDYGPLIPVMLKDLHIPASQAGLMSTLLFIGLAATYLPGGILVDRYGQRPVLLGSLLLMTLGGVLLPLWPQIYWILACRIVIGFGSGAAFIAGAGVVAGMGKHAAQAQGFYGGSVQIGSGLGLLVTPMLASQLGWQGAFLFWGLAGLPALVFWMFVSDGWEARSGGKVDVVAGLRSPAVWSLGLVHMGTFGVGNAIAAWISVYFVSKYGISLGLAAAFGALGLIAGAVIRPLGGLLLGRKVVSLMILLRAGTLLAALGVVLLALPLRQPVVTLLGLVALATGSTLPYASVFDSAAQLKTVSKGVAQGLVSVIACQTILWGPPLIGYLYQLTGTFSLAFGAILFFSSIAINASLLANFAFKYERRV